jgi:NadR type nicotinamide-nucleotide adenylyltransferase
MEKRFQTTGSGRLMRVAIIGPESTGKTTLSEQLAKHYKSLWIPEYAREYIEGLDHPYTYDDVVHIAGMQVKLEQEHIKKASEYLFYDTDLIITKIWFEWVYNKCPDWIDWYIAQNKIDLYLLCDTDLEWVADNVRENGGDNREKLFITYRNELERYGLIYEVVTGSGKVRLNNALRFIENTKKVI